MQFSLCSSPTRRRTPNAKTTPIASAATTARTVAMRPEVVKIIAADPSPGDGRNSGSDRSGHGEALANAVLLVGDVVGLAGLEVRRQEDGRPGRDRLHGSKQLYGWRSAEPALEPLPSVGHRL